MKKLLFVLFALFININSTLAGDNSNYLFSENGCVIDKKIT
jgi:hypothetical protein